MRNVSAGARPLPSVVIAAPVARDAAPGAIRQEWLDNEGRLIATGGQTGTTWWMHWSGLATFWFDVDGDVRAEPARPGCDEQIHDTFTRGVTPVVLLARRYEGFHASAVLGTPGVVAFVGTSGTGKSTIALAVSATGLPHFADDAVMYRVVGDSVEGIRLPFPVRVEPSARLAAAGFRRETPGATSTASAAPIHRIYHLVRDSSIETTRPSFSAVPISRRFELLLAHAHPFDMGAEERRRAFVENLMTVARTVEVWECRFAPDLRALSALASAVRDHLDAPSRPAAPHP